jgi:hypothetical protein
MAEVFSDDFNLKIGDLLSHPVYPATRQPFAPLFMPGALLHVCARARSRLRTRFTSAPVVESDLSHALSRVFQEPKTLPEYKHFEPSDLSTDPLNPSPGKNTYFLLKHRHLEAGLFLALPRCAHPHIASPRLSHPSTCTPTLRISHLHKHHT